MADIIGRHLGIDYGTRRIGLAISDRRGCIASPDGILAGTGRPPADADALLRRAREREAAALVVGLPLNMDGSDSAQTKLSRGLAAELEKRGDLPVALWDERLSSFQADQLMEAAQVPTGRRQARRDALAAQVMLQSYLDAQRDRSDSPPPTNPL